MAHQRSGRGRKQGGYAPAGKHSHPLTRADLAKYLTTPSIGDGATPEGDSQAAGSKLTARTPPP